MDDGSNVYLPTDSADEPEFYVLNPQRLDQLVTGGLLVACFLIGTLAALALPLLRKSGIVGSLAVSAAVALLATSGSKAIGCVYMIYVVMYLYRFRREPTVRRYAPLAIPLGVATAVVALLVGTRTRYQGQEVDARSAITTSVSRFTLQEVAAVLYSRPDWCERFRGVYVRDNLLSFIPGFVWAQKPINPAYQINDLYTARQGSISAASPSLFGALLIVTGPWLYWPGLLLAMVVMAAIERHLTRGPAYEHYEWLYFYGVVTLFEATFVIALCQLALVAAWRRFLIVFRQGTAGNRRWSRPEAGGWRGRPAVPARSRGTL